MTRVVDWELLLHTHFQLHELNCGASKPPLRLNTENQAAGIKEGLRAAIPSYSSIMLGMRGPAFDRLWFQARGGYCRSGGSSLFIGVRNARRERRVPVAIGLPVLSGFRLLFVQCRGREKLFQLHEARCQPLLV